MVINNKIFLISIYQLVYYKFHNVDAKKQEIVVLKLFTLIIYFCKMKIGRVKLKISSEKPINKKGSTPILMDIKFSMRNQKTKA